MTTFEIISYDNNDNPHETQINVESLAAAKQYVGKNFQAGLGGECAASTIICDVDGNILAECNHLSDRNEWK